MEDVSSDSKENDITTQLSDPLNADLPPDHALLQRAQQALKAQLLQIKQDLSERVREKQKALKDVQSQRQARGVELYGFQERLATLHKTLEESQERAMEANKLRLETEHMLVKAKDEVYAAGQDTAGRKRKATAAQVEVDRLNTAVKQIESYNEEARIEAHVAQREAEATEATTRRLAEEKDEQDFLIVDLQKTSQRREEESRILKAQLNAQIEEKRTADATLAEAERDMENVHYEKKQLLTAWKSSLVYLQQKDEVLQTTEQQLHQQMQRTMDLKNEKQATVQRISKEQATVEQLASLISKLGSDAEVVMHKITEKAAEREAYEWRLTLTENEMRDIQGALDRAESESKSIEDASESCRRRYVTICKDTQSLHDIVLSSMHEQTTTARSANKAMIDIRRLVKEQQKAEIEAIVLRSDLAKLQIVILNTQRHNVQLKETMSALVEDLKERSLTVEEMETESKKRERNIEKQTRELDALNRRYQQLTTDMEDASTGPMEATIHNLTREIQNKGKESQELQRAWMQHQMELVSMEHSNNELSETLSLMQAKTTVMKQKKRRLDAQLQQHLVGLKCLKNAMRRLHRDIQSLNSVTAQNEELTQLLSNETFVIESEIAAEIKEMESHSRNIENSIEQTTEEKRDVLSEMVETEKQIMIWERRLELEREMQAALEPEMGADMAHSMRKEIHRMERQLGDLLRHQESLIREMEIAIEKHQNIRLKTEVLQQRDAVEAQLQRAVVDLRRNVRSCSKEIQQTERRLNDLRSKRAVVMTDVDSYRHQCPAVEEQLHDLRSRLRQASQLPSASKTRHAGIAKKFEDAIAGRFRPPLHKREGRIGELQKAVDKATTIREILSQHQVATLAHGLARLDALDVVFG